MRCLKSVLQSKILIKSKAFPPQLKLWNVFDDFFMLAQKKQNAQTKTGSPDSLLSGVKETQFDHGDHRSADRATGGEYRRTYLI